MVFVTSLFLAASWPTYQSQMQTRCDSGDQSRLPGGITRSQSVGFHQVFQIGEIGFSQSLEQAHDKRFGQLDEAALAHHQPRHLFRELSGREPLEKNAPRVSSWPIASSQPPLKSKAQLLCRSSSTRQRELLKPR